MTESIQPLKSVKSPQLRALQSSLSTALCCRCVVKIIQVAKTLPPELYSNWYSRGKIRSTLPQRSFSSFSLLPSFKCIQFTILRQPPPLIVIIEFRVQKTRESAPSEKTKRVKHILSDFDFDFSLHLLPLFGLNGTTWVNRKMMMMSTTTTMRALRNFATI